MKHYKLIFLIFLHSFYISCNNLDEAYSDKGIKFYKTENFPTINKVASEKLTFFSDSVVLPDVIHVIDDYIIFLDNESNKPLHLFSLKQNKYIGSYGKLGEGPEEFQTPALMTNNDNNSFLIYDQISRKTLGYTITSLLDNKPFFELKMNQNENCSSVNLIDNNLYYLDFLNPSSRIYKFDTITNKTIGYGSLLKNYRNASDIVFAQACDAKMSYKNKNFIIAYRFAPFFEIFNTNTNKWKSILTIDNYAPIYEEVSRNSKKIFSLKNGETKLGFLSIDTSSKYIYLLYSGEQKEIGKPYMGNKILVFDYDGNPINYYELDKPISTFKVIEDEIVIGVHIDVDFDFIKFKLNGNK